MPTSLTVHHTTLPSSTLTIPSNAWLLSPMLLLLFHSCHQNTVLPAPSAAGWSSATRAPFGVSSSSLCRWPPPSFLIIAVWRLSSLSASVAIPHVHEPFVLPLFPAVSIVFNRPRSGYSRCVVAALPNSFHPCSCPRLASFLGSSRPVIFDSRGLDQSFEAVCRPLFGSPAWLWLALCALCAIALARHCLCTLSLTPPPISISLVSRLLYFPAS
jgi:hypothetical protein